MSLALVADNGNANKSLFRQLEAWCPWMLCIGCNAQGTKLALQDLFNHVPVIKQAMSAVDRILRIFKNNPNMHEILLRAQASRPVSLLQWVCTRWNSKVQSMDA